LVVQYNIIIHPYLSHMVYICVSVTNFSLSV